MRSRVAAGKLHRVHHGVYAVGHPVLTRAGEFLAAVLACGDRAALSHFAAAEHVGLVPRASVIDITCATGAGRSRHGIRAHGGRLLARDVIVKSQIRCTSVARTILDVADYLDLRGVERVVDQAEIQRLLDMRAMKDVLARARGRRGVGKVAAVLAVNAQPTITKSEMEELLLGICRDFDLPLPLVNRYVEGEQVDFHWPGDRLIVETDGSRWHGTTRRRERDNARDRKLQLAGWRVLRFSWREIAEAPAEVAAEIRAHLTEPAALRIAS